MNLFISDKEKKIKNFLIKIKRKKKNKIIYLNNFIYGIYGLKALNNQILYTFHFFTIHKMLLKLLKKKGNFIFNVYPLYTITKKPNGLRMGGGKGKVDTWYTTINTGLIFGEIESILSFDQFRLFFKICLSKIPLNFKLINLKIDKFYLYNK